MDKLVNEINRLELSMLHKTGGKVELAQPTYLSEVIAKIAIYLSQLSDEVTNSELAYKQSRAARFDSLLKDGEKPTSAERLIRFDKELIKVMCIQEGRGRELTNLVTCKHVRVIIVSSKVNAKNMYTPPACT